MGAQDNAGRLRFETARTALEGNNKSLKQIAVDSGYTDEASFRRTVKKLSRMTLGEYRKWSRIRQA
jgi:transcriptional regulator GlxA family with amidase domain